MRFSVLSKALRMISGIHPTQLKEVTVIREWVQRLNYKKGFAPLAFFGMILWLTSPCSRPRRSRSRPGLYVIGSPAAVQGHGARSHAGALDPEHDVEEVNPAGIQDTVPSPTGRTRIERRASRWMFCAARSRG